MILCLNIFLDIFKSFRYNIFMINIKNKKKKIFTIHPGDSDLVYGYETSQLSRQKICEYLDYKYLHLLTSPQLLDDWKSLYTGFGFNKSSVYSISNVHSDCGHDDLSITINQLDDKFLNGNIEYRDSFVSSVDLDGDIWYFTSAPYLCHKKEGILEWYHKDGTLSMKAKYFNPNVEPTPIKMIYPSYLYYKDGVWLDTEDLIISFLNEHCDMNDVIIRDKYQIITPKLWRYVEFRDFKYYEYIHNNVLSVNIDVLRFKTNYLVASETLCHRLSEKGLKVSFLPPIALTNIFDGEPEYKQLKRYCFIGNMTSVKRLDFALNVFQKLYDDGYNITLDLYGHLDKSIQLPPNVNFRGHYSNVPRTDYDGYISTSSSEVFANACVESMGDGLVCLLSDVDFAHRYYFYNLSDSNCVFLFNDESELYDLIVKLNDVEFYHFDKLNDFIHKYSIEEVSFYYEKL